MNCLDWSPMLPGLVVGALPDATAGELRLHLGECSACRLEHQQLANLFLDLSDWSIPDANPALAERTYDGIVTVIHASADVSPGPMVSIGGWWQTIDQWLQKVARHRPTLVSGLASLAIVVALSAHVSSPLWHRGRSMGGVTGCRTNLRVLSCGLHQYASQHGGHYPRTLSELGPPCLQKMPCCPSAGQPTYAYFVSEDQRHYRLYCHGRFHQDAGLMADQPALSGPESAESHTRGEPSERGRLE